MFWLLCFWRELVASKCRNLLAATGLTVLNPGT